MILGVDVGGTFSDLVLWDGARLRTAKTATTADQSEGVVSGAIALARGADVNRFLHGTTVATNAVLEGKGARTALVTTEGFGDVIEIGRQDRPSLYDSFLDRPPVLVDPDLRFETPRNGSGTGFGESLAAAAPEAVAISLLYGYERDDLERRVADAVHGAVPGVPVSVSHEVVPEFREYERTATTVLNAYLQPVAAAYLRRLVARSAAAGLPGAVSVMRSSGGLITTIDAARFPASILLSGPAGGVVASAAVGRELGKQTLISFDMGGTSTDVCRIEAGVPELHYEQAVGGHPCRMPSVAVHTVGAGGGSLGWVDAGGSLRVGPESAGANPGPACYGRGGQEAAVTDANVVLGRLAAGEPLAGGLRLDGAAASSAVARLGDRVGLDPPATALGMIAVVEEHMAAAIRAVSIEQGSDPRRAALVAFGGAGGLHATALARALDMDGVAIPRFAGVFSALGLLLAPPRADAARTVLLREGDAGQLETTVAAVVDRASGALTAAVDTVDEVRAVVDVRYLGQAHETSVPYRPGAGWGRLAADFHDLHRLRNGFARPDDPIEVVTVRAEAIGTPALTWGDLPELRPQGEAVRGRRDVRTGRGTVAAGVWWRPALAPGASIEGPAVIEEPEATTFLDAGEHAVVHPSGTIEVEW